MNYFLMPSLKHFALIKIAITLWNSEDIIRVFTGFYFKEQEWKVAENHVLEKVKELPLPKSLKKEVLNVIRPIGIEIHEFIDNHLHFLCVEIHEYMDNRLHFLWDKSTDIKVRKRVDSHFHTLSDGIKVRFRSLIRKSFKKLCWTPHGTVDRRKTAEIIVSDENLDIRERYKLACIYCLEDDILMLWNKMPEDCKKSFYNKGHPNLVNRDELVVFWTYDIKGEVTRMHYIAKLVWLGCTPYQYAFNYAVSSGNKPATEHFLQKLTSEERKESLKRYVFPHKDTFCYLLSQMNEEQQVGMFREYPYSVVNCLLDWPLQGLFVEKAKHMWAFLDEIFDDVYCWLLTNIIDKVKKGFKDFNYLKLFRETVQHATTLERENLIFSDEGKNICKSLIYENEMDLLEFFVQESISSKDLMIKFREEFERYIICSHSKAVLEEEKDVWNKVFQLLNDLTQKFDKRRCVEEGNNGPVKKFCSFTNEYQSTSKKI